MMKTDGNFFVYQATIPNVTSHPGDKALWDTNTDDTGKGPWSFVLQTDGTLVVIDSTNEKLWDSDTGGMGEPPYVLTMQNNGNLVLYDSNPFHMWSTDTGVK